MIEYASRGKQRVRDRALVLLLLDTGCRIGELCKAEVGDVDMDQGSITFQTQVYPGDASLTKLLPGLQEVAQLLRGVI